VYWNRIEFSGQANHKNMKKINFSSVTLDRHGRRKYLQCRSNCKCNFHRRKIIEWCSM